jgi:hypothetical protein
LDREGHEFLVHVDRNFIKDQRELYGLHKILKEELSNSNESLKKSKFNMYLKHLYYSAAPT